MKVLGVVCSPRVNGNTQVLMEEALRAARELEVETELYLVARKKISPCDGCETCQKTGECYIDDDMQELYTKLMEADGIILGSPVYYWSVSSQAKAVIDRCFRFRQQRELTNKVGGAIVVARNRGETTAMTTIMSFFAAQRLVVAGAASARGDQRGDVVNDRTGMEDARRIGRAVAALLHPDPSAARER